MKSFTAKGGHTFIGPRSAHSTPQWNAMRRGVLLLLLLSCAFGIHAESATFRVTLTKGSKALLTRNIVVALNTPTAISHSIPFRMTGGCATGPDGKPDRIDGVGHSAQTITVKPVAIERGGVTTVVTLADSELAVVVPTTVGPCKAATPGMLKWDASARLELAPGAASSFAAGDYTVIVTLLGADPSRSVQQTVI